MVKAISASTLSRQAAKTKNKAEAKRLRARAAKLRREARLVKISPSKTVYGLKPRPAEKIMAGQHEVLNHAARAASVDHTPLANAPGHGEVVGGYLAHMAKGLAELARKKGGVDAIQARLSTLEHQTRHDAKFDARQREQKAVQAAREEMRDKTVCGFLAVVAAADVTGVPPAVWCVNAFTVANLVDALKANGYSANGKS